MDIREVKQYAQQVGYLAQLLEQSTVIIEQRNKQYEELQRELKEIKEKEEGED